MAIAFKCPGCAKKYQVGDQMAGRRGKCQVCKTAFVIPAPKVVAAAQPGAALKPDPKATHFQEPAIAEAPESAPPSAVVAKSAVAPPAPPTEEAPQNGAVVEARRTEPEPIAAPPVPIPEPEVPSPDAAPTPPEREREETAPTQRRSASRPARRWILWTVAGTVVLGIVLLVAFWPRRDEDLGDESRFFPSGTQIVLHLRTGDVLGSPLWKDVQKDNPELFKSALSILADRLGVGIDQTDHVTAALSFPADGILLVRTKAAVAGPEIAAKIKRRAFTESKAGDHSLYEANDGAAFGLAGNKLVLLGPKPLVSEALNHGTSVDLSPGLESALKKMDRGRVAAFALDLKGLLPADAQDVGPLTGGPDLDSLRKIVCVYGYGKIDLDITLVATIVCEDPDSAKEIVPVVENWLRHAKALLAQQGEFRNVAEWLDSAKIHQTGSTAELTLTIKAAQVRDFVRGGGVERLLQHLQQ